MNDELSLSCCNGTMVVRRIALACVLGITWMSVAEGQIIFEDNSNPGEVTDLTGFATTGSDMAGSLQVTAFFLGGLSETVSWQATGPGAGEAAGTGWTLRESGDTFGDPNNSDVGLWRISVSSPNVFIDRLLLAGVNPDQPERGVVFDRTEPSFGTPGSYRGRDFEIHTIATIVGLDPGFDEVEVTYRVPIDSLADGPGIVGDLFGELLINPIRSSSAEPGVFYAANELTFYADTDTVGQFDPGSFDPTRPEIPEPSSLTLLWFAGVGLLSYRRKR